jgi:hypothetical protein
LLVALAEAVALRTRQTPEQPARITTLQESLAIHTPVELVQNPFQQTVPALKLEMDHSAMAVEAVVAVVAGSLAQVEEFMS